MTWRVALIDSCGGALEGCTAASGEGNASIADAAAFVPVESRIECRETVADPTGHGSRIAQLFLSGRPVELLLGQVFTDAAPCSGAAVAAAIEWAVERGAGLIHMSLGLAGDRAVVRAAVRRALEAGCVLVAAAPARGGTVYPAAYAGVIRATGDARCAPDELSALGLWLFGGCPRLVRAGQPASGRPDGRVSGGASIGAAWVTHSILQEAVLEAPAVVAGLTARAKYQGPERRTETSDGARG